MLLPLNAAIYVLVMHDFPEDALLLQNESTLQLPFNQDDKVYHTTCFYLLNIRSLIQNIEGRNVT